MHSGTPGLGAAGVYMWKIHHDDMSESRYFKLSRCAPCHRPYRRRVPGALPLTGRANAFPDRRVLNRRAKAPLHFIYRPQELDSLERADAESGGVFFASDWFQKSGVWRAAPF